VTQSRLAGARRRIRGAGWLVPVLDALLEGAWIAVIDAVFAAVAHTTALGPIPFAIAAGASIYVVRHAADRNTNIAGLGGLYVLAFIVGGLLGGPLSGAAPIAGQTVGFTQASGIFMAVAVFRGSRHPDSLDDDLVNGSLLQWGFPVLAVPWLLASQFQGAERDAFTATAFPSTLVFAAAGLLALGLARLESLSASSGVNWRSNRAWFVLLLSVLGVMVLIAIPSAFLLGAPLLLLGAGLLGPLAVVLTPIGAVLGTLIEVLLTPIVDFLTSLIHTQTQQQQQPVQSTGAFVPPDAGQGDPAFAGGIVVLVLVVIALIGFVLFLRATYKPRPRAAAEPGAVLEEREFRLPKLSIRRPKLGGAPRRPRPTTASGAYRAFLADLDALPHLARLPDEPPGTHAGRLRAAGFTDRRASMLAADYQLERYALRDLPARETNRALVRWTALRAAVRALPKSRSDQPPKDGGAT
jgi:hypothetical protein